MEMPREEAMNQNLWQKLKRVKFADLLHIFLFLAAIPASFFYRKYHKNLWLFCDLAGEARDNGYWLFQYVRKEHLEVDAVFAIDAESPDYRKVQMLGKTVQFGSYLHWVVYLSAQYVISSQKASGPNASVCYVLERFKLFRGNKIFLQHGIIKDNISFLYYKYTNIRLFTCSTKRELDYVREHYGYPKDYVQLLGLCRFDELLKPVKTENRIVIMPTWRKWLSHPTEGISADHLERSFLTSGYYRYWSRLLDHSGFLCELEKNDWTVTFYLHREAQKYSKFFTSSHPRVEIGTFPNTDVQSLLKSAKILITDYSSVAMDFALLDKPLFYYQFDYEEFRKRHLEEGYFNYECDGFGPVCYDESDLIERVISMIKGSGVENAMYQIRRDEFFTLKDRDNCKRTYDAVKNIL